MRPEFNRVFITGAGIVSAAGVGLQDFFQSLRQAKSGIRPIRRFPAETLATRYAGEVDLSELVSPPQNPGTAWNAQKDPKAFMAWTALSQISSGLPENTGLVCSIGLEAVDVQAINEANHARPVCPEFPPTALPNLLWTLAGFSGNVFVQVSACAAGTIAIGTAFRRIRAGLENCLVAGGVDSMMFPYGIHAFNSLGALSERNDLGPAAISPFDLNRSGTLLGEGAAFLVLESEAHISQTGRTPIAEITGYGSSMDAWHAVMPDPSGNGAIAAMKASLKDAKINPDQIDYINAHGTATRHNDSMESRAILSLFGERGKTLPVSSTKPFVGHLLTAAGAVETVASLLPFSDEILPPTLNWKTPDPECPIDCVPNIPRSAKPIYIMKNSYGFGGQNASLILKRL